MPRYKVILQGGPRPMKFHTQEVAQLLRIELSSLRLLLRQRKIKSPPILFDPRTKSAVRMWSEADIEHARKVLQRV